ncbi:MAG: cytochrome c maturation protein CcmE [Acidobacteriota bacterium]
MSRSKLPYLFGAALLVIFAGFSFTQFTDALTPYVDYEQAMRSDRTVQVAGGLLAKSSRYHEDEGMLRFTLVDENGDHATLPVRYEGLKPANFEDAISIVAIGQFDASAGEFAAHDLLVKCPSKYQGIDESTPGTTEPGTMKSYDSEDRA